MDLATRPAQAADPRWRHDRDAVASLAERHRRHRPYEQRSLHDYHRSGTDRILYPFRDSEGACAQGLAADARWLDDLVSTWTQAFPSPHTTFRAIVLGRTLQALRCRPERGSPRSCLSVTAK